MTPKLDCFHDYRKGIRYNFIAIPTVLIYDDAYRKMSLQSIMLYTLILNRMHLSERNHWIDDHGVYVFYSIPNICEDLRCSEPSAIKYRKELIDYGLIDFVKTGQGNISKIYPHDFAEILSEENEESSEKNEDEERTLSSSVPTNDDLIEDETEEQEQYMPKDSLSEEAPEGSVDTPKNVEYTDNARGTKMAPLELKNFKFKNSKNFSSRTKKTLVQELKNFSPEKECLEKDNNIYNTSINPPKQKNQKDESIDRWTEQDFEKRIRENLAIDTMQERTDWPDLDQYLELYRLMIDACRTTKPTIRIGGQECPVEKVRERFLELNSSHLLYVIDAMKKNTTEIRNIRSYLLTALYRSPETKTNFYQAWVNHDFSSPEQPRAKNPHGNPSPSYTDDELADLERKLLQ